MKKLMVFAFFTLTLVGNTMAQPQLKYSAKESLDKKIVVACGGEGNAAPCPSTNNTKEVEAQDNLTSIQS